MSANLVQSIQQIVENVLDNRGLTNMELGTVTSIDPLKITILTTMLPIPPQMLQLTEGVMRKVIYVRGHIHNINTLSHTHTTSGLGHSHSNSGTGTIGEALTGTYESNAGLTGSYPTLGSIENMQVYEDGVALPSTLVPDPENPELMVREVVINPGLALNDKVILMKVYDGQRFIVLSRVFEIDLGEEEGGTQRVNITRGITRR